MLSMLPDPVEIRSEWSEVGGLRSHFAIPDCKIAAFTAPSPGYHSNVRKPCPAITICYCYPVTPGTKTLSPQRRKESLIVKPVPLKSIPSMHESSVCPSWKPISFTLLKLTSDDEFSNTCHLTAFVIMITPSMLNPFAFDEVRGLVFLFLLPSLVIHFLTVWSLKRITPLSKILVFEASHTLTLPWRRASQCT